MEKGFMHFINQVPPEEYRKVKVETYTDADIIVFRPSSYLIGMKTYIRDYHFVFPVCTPPPIKVGKHEYQCGKGRIAMIAPDTIITCNKYAPTHPYIAMNIKEDFLHEVALSAFGKIIINSSSLVNTPYSSKLISLINYFGEELENYNESCKLMLQSISMQIAIQILRETGNDSLMKNNKPADAYNYLKIAKEYMRAHFNANIKIEDICKHIHISPYYFMHMFKEQTGRTPHEFLLALRLEKAEEMLKNGNYSIEEVGTSCGFVDAAHFSKAFKRAKGITPSRYKRIYFIF